MGRVDIYESRRTHFSLCRFWIREEDDVNDSHMYIYENEPDGVFYAKEAVAETSDFAIHAGIYMADTHSITLETEDDLDGIVANSIVEYNGEIWLVSNVQKVARRKRSQFAKKLSYKWIISIRR